MEKMEKKIDEIGKMVHEISTEVACIKTTVVEGKENEILRNQILQTMVLSNKERIIELENKYTWVVRSILASIIGAVATLILKFGG